MSCFYSGKLKEVLPKERCATATREELIEGNMQLVLHLAKQYCHNENDKDDMIQEGMQGLMKAADKYDPSKGCSFGTYACHWIRQYILRFIEENRLIRVPNYMFEKKQEHRRYYQMAKNAIEKTFSIDSMTNESHFEIMDENSEMPYTKIDIEELNAIVRRIMYEVLNEKERFVIASRFNLYDEYDYEPTLGDVGEQLHLTRERIRQIENKALEKLQKRLLYEMERPAPRN